MVHCKEFRINQSERFIKYYFSPQKVPFIFIALKKCILHPTWVHFPSGIHWVMVAMVSASLSALAAKRCVDK